MRIGFITDTNLLKKQDDELFNTKKFLNDTDFFIDYIEALNRTTSEDKLVYLMPNVIIDELYYQKVNAFKSQYETFNKKYKEISYGITGNMPTNNIENVLKKEKSEYTDKFKIMELKYSKKIFQELVNDAMRKNPPFDKSKENKKSDAGYKDALIWKTILYDESISEYDKIYLFSCDKIFKDNEEYLNKEFKKEHPSTELIIKFFNPDGQQRQNSLQAIITENGLFETEIIKLYNIELILEKIKEVRYNYEQEVFYVIEDKKIILRDINFKDFSREDFIIRDVVEDDGKYKVFIRFNTKKYISSEEIDVDNKKELLGKIILIFEKKKNDFKLIDQNIKNIEFYFNYFGSLSVGVTNLLKGIYGSAFQETIENLKNALAISVEPFKKMQENIASISSNFNSDAFKMLTTGIMDSDDENSEEEDDEENKNEENKEEE